jgi:RHS repeat-associated protein
VVNYAYDDNGNRLSKIAQFTPAGSEPKLKESYYTYDTASNRLIKTQAGTTSQNLSYDKMGSVINDGQHRYLYDGHERLIQINRPDNVRLARYVLNGLGQRVRKLTASGEVRFVYDDAGHVLGEYTNAGKVIQETVYLGDTPVAVMTGSAVSYIYTDHLNAPRVITDSAGKAIWQWDADPFGVTLANADPDGDGVKFVYNLRFPGQYFDSETGLHYNYFRDYNPSTGRYIESDPIGLRGGLNTYGYVGGNPLNAIDPDGHNPLLILRLLSAFVPLIDLQMMAVDDVPSGGMKITKLHPNDLIPTQPLTKSGKQMKRLSDEIDKAGEITESLKYVERGGKKYLVDGHHRQALACRKGIKEIPAEQVELPYKGYKTEKDLDFSQY